MLEKYCLQFLLFCIIINSDGFWHPCVLAWVSVREVFVKNMNLLVWLGQLGISVAVPPAVLIFLGVWLRSRFDLGNWVVITAVLIGVICAVNGLRTSLKLMENMARNKKEEKTPVSFNDHH